MQEYTIWFWYELEFIMEFGSAFFFLCTSEHSIWFSCKLEFIMQFGNQFLAISFCCFYMILLTFFTFDIANVIMVLYMLELRKSWFSYLYIYIYIYYILPGKVSNWIIRRNTIWLGILEKKLSKMFSLLTFFHEF